MLLQNYRDDGIISGTALIILSELLERKKKREKWRKREALSASGLIFFTGTTLIYIFFLHTESLGSMHQLRSLIGSPVVWMLLSLSMAGLLFFSYCHNEREDAEDDYDELREEIIERSDELWPAEQPDANGDTKHYRILHQLKKEFDINLFYK
ncbi:YpbF family protein [Sporolactobacillus sp. CPB3-1]|uniref:YpbF family protein n=1 Tax=Sporolactobacillus mangiferae TaxID=2940498 RepID=A0ABT0MB06_9BACL|nr:DUF2663 family protein [Sporolactobacillus mangiferae]MCL1631853.1 YpbF family protein [Sporolactobacillus mangiferae]